MVDDLFTEKIIKCAMKVLTGLGPGFLESVYENAFAHELRKAGFLVECQKQIPVYYDTIMVGDFVADMLVEDEVIVENKAVNYLVSAHEVQLVNYLAATGINIGLLFNFGANSLQFKRKYRVYRAKGG